MIAASQISLQRMMDRLAGPHNERRLPSKNYNRGKNGMEKEKRKTKNDVTRLDAERGLQQVDGDQIFMIQFTCRNQGMMLGGASANTRS